MATLLHTWRNLQSVRTISAIDSTFSPCARTESESWTNHGSNSKSGGWIAIVRANVHDNYHFATGKLLRPIDSHIAILIFFLRFCFAGYKCIGCNLIDKRFFRQLRRNSGTETAATLQSCHGHEIAQRFRSTLIEITKSKLLSECSPYTFRRLCVLS